MKLRELKERVFEEWKDHCWFKRSVIQPELFKTEIRKDFGDLRRKVTWEKALCRFRALNAKIGLLDAYTLILSTFNFTPDDWDYEYRHQIVEEFLMLPNGLELIKLGLEQLLSVDFTSEERGKAHGFFELVRTATRGELSGITTKSPRKLAARARAS
jgi:hypothetical protein